MMRVNEIFGPTIQGEGPHSGQRCTFLRLAECNLACSWCDTPYTWDWNNHDRAVESRQMAVEDVCELLVKYDCDRIVITGGEPMIQQRFFPEIALSTGCEIDVETNGTVMPHPDYVDAVDLFVVSPKLAHSGDTEKLRIKQPALTEFANMSRYGKAVFKFVAASESDLDEVQGLEREYGIPKSAIWVMPEGKTRSAQIENMQHLADATIAYGYNISSRLHVLIWNDRRGV